MHQVLYRKWRPAAFSDVIGQPHVTETLKQEVQSSRLSHAYLFTGSRGTGKTSCAKILAKAVNCLNPQGGDPCNQCEICRGIDNGSIYDVVEIDAASNNGVDNIRDLREEANFTPAAAKYRVYIIDEVHMLSTGAFNALLKTLEEPPAHVIFILATTEAHKLPATILSRCQRFDFHRIGPEDMAGRLSFVAQQETISLTDDAALLIGRLADGALRDALSLLDQCAGGGPVDSETVMRTAGLAGRDHLFELSAAAQQGDSAAGLERIAKLYDASFDMERLCAELIEHYRSLMLVKTMNDPQRLLLCPAEELLALKRQAAAMSLSETLRAMDLLQDALERLRRGSSRRTEMEMAFIRLASPLLDASPAALLARIEQLEAGLSIGTRSLPAVPRSDGQTVTQKTATSLPEKKPALCMPDTQTAVQETKKAVSPVVAADNDEDHLLNDVHTDRPPEDVPLPVSVPSSSADMTDPVPLPTEPTWPSQSCEPALVAVPDGKLAHWPEVVSALSKRNPLMSSVLKGSCAYVHGDILLIDSANAQFRDLIRDGTRNKNDIRDAVQSVTGQVFRLGPYTKKNSAAPDGNDPFKEFLHKMRSQGMDI